MRYHLSVSLYAATENCQTGQDPFRVPPLCCSRYVVGAVRHGATLTWWLPLQASNTARFLKPVQKSTYSRLLSVKFLSRKHSAAYFRYTSIVAQRKWVVKGGFLNLWLSGRRPDSFFWEILLRRPQIFRAPALGIFRRWVKRGRGAYICSFGKSSCAVPKYSLRFAQGIFQRWVQRGRGAHICSFGKFSCAVPCPAAFPKRRAKALNRPVYYQKCSSGDNGARFITSFFILAARWQAL